MFAKGTSTFGVGAGVGEVVVVVAAVVWFVMTLVPETALVCEDDAGLGGYILFMNMNHPTNAIMQRTKTMMPVRSM